MNIRVQSTLATLFAALTFATTASAGDPAVGMWKTQPDRKNLTSHIEVRQCGANLCGKVVKAFDPSGKEVKTKNVGKELFWGVEPKGNGVYENGTVVVPLLNVKAKAGMVLKGSSLHVSGCKGRLCDGQVWSRI